MTTISYPPKPVPGDRIAVISPGTGLPGFFPNSPEEADRYAADQREAVLRAMRVHAPHTTIVFDVDFGHTDPQLVIPYGGLVRVDGPARRITVTY